MLVQHQTVRRSVSWITATASSVAAVSAIWTVTILWSFQTALTATSERMAEGLEFRNELEPFYVRLGTTKLMELLHWLFPSAGMTLLFSVVNFVFLAACGPALMALVARFGGGRTAQWIAFALFYTNYSVALMFVATVEGWDDPLQYFLVLTSLIAFTGAIRGSRWSMVLFVALFTASLLVRESGLVLLPVLLTLWWPPAGPGRIVTLIRRAIVLGVPVIGYVCYRLLVQVFGKQEFAIAAVPRFAHLAINFGRQDLTRHTLTVLVLVLLPVVYVYVLCRAKLSYQSKVAVVLGIALNTIVVLTTALAWEGRLLFLPMLVAIPLLAVASEALWRPWPINQVIRSCAGNWRFWLVLVLAEGAAAVVGIKAWPWMPPLFLVFAVAQFGIIACHAVVRRYGDFSHAL